MFLIILMLVLHVVVVLVLHELSLVHELASKPVGVIVLAESTGAVVKHYCGEVVPVFFIENFLDGFVDVPGAKPTLEQEHSVLRDLISKHMFFDYGVEILLREILSTMWSVQGYPIVEVATEKICDCVSNKELVMWNVIHEWGIWLDANFMMDRFAYYNAKAERLPLECLYDMVMVCNVPLPYRSLSRLVNFVHPRWHCMTSKRMEGVKLAHS